MSVAGDLLAVQRRIDEIAGTPGFAGSAFRNATALPTGFTLQAMPLAPATLPTLPRTVAASPAQAAHFGALVRGDVARLARESAALAGVDPALVGAVIEVESGGDASATSPVGAAGLMQLMPQTAQALGVSNPYDPAQNVRAGASYLRQLLDRFHGEIPAAVAAYNAGPGAVERFGGVPPYHETAVYVARVMEAYRAARTR